MKITLTSLVPAPAERVFAALVDPAVLQRCIPGCESLVEIGPDLYEATLKIGVAGLKGTYTGKASIRDRQPPASLTLDANVQVGGLIAASAHRLVDVAAKKLADDFFRELSSLLNAEC